MPRMSPKLPIGTVPGGSFINRPDEFYLTKVGLITRVDEVNLKADIKVLTGGHRYEVDLTQGLAGPRSFWGGVPEVNSLVVLGYRRIHKNLYDAVILGYLPVGNKSGNRFDPWAPGDPSEVSEDEAELYAEHLGGTIRYKRLQLRSGNVGGMSSQGAEFVLSTDVQAVNRAGDSWELRDSDRTLVEQVVHRVSGESGIKRIAGPLRRSAFYLPEDILVDGKVPAASSETYYGRDELQKLGPGQTAGVWPKFCDQDGKLLPIFNDFKQFPPTTYSDGSKAHYPPTLVGVDVEAAKGGADAFTEDRLEMSHTSALTQDVLEEVDGISIDQRPPYIERVLGTLVGNDMFSTAGIRQYAKVLKPKLFKNFYQMGPGKFTTETCKRGPTEDIEAHTAAGAYLFRVRPPRSYGDSAFCMAVTKEGKFLLTAPGSRVEDYGSGVNNVSGEVSLEGALKLFLGATNPDRVSLFLNLLGGIKGEIGHSSSGHAIDLKYRSAVRVEYKTATPTDDPITESGVGGVAFEQMVKGARRTQVTGKAINKYGSVQTVVDGAHQVQCDRYGVQAMGGYSGNYGELNVMVAGKTQSNHAQQVLENIAVGGKVSTILAGGLIQNVGAGAITYTATAGATAFNNPAGSWSVAVGTGAISMATGAGVVSLSTAAGAMSLGAGVGVISMTAGLAVNIMAATVFSVLAPQMLFGGPAAVLGVARGIPALPPGTPTLDTLTGLPVQGSAMVRSL